MNKKDFFVKENDIVDLDIFGQVFKFKKTNADDELDWVEYYQERYVEEVKGKKVVKFKENLKKLAKCKLWNVVEVPFTQEELKKICGLDKPYSKYTNEDKSLLFGKLEGDVMTELIVKVDATKKYKKKS